MKIESQEQNLRRPRLWFYNIKVQVDESGKTVHPVENAARVLCRNSVGLNLLIDYIGTRGYNNVGKFNYRHPNKADANKEANSPFHS